MHLNLPQQWFSCGMTHEGKVRKLNEDAFLDRRDIGLWAVADGMGGHDAGDYASSSIINALKTIPAPTRLSDFVNIVEDKVAVINAELQKLSHEQHSGNTVGSTVVILLAYDDFCALMWAGDSRAYRTRSGLLTQLTHDHSQVQELIELGMLNQDQAETHPDANIITHAVGASPQLYLEVEVTEVEACDTFVLCSDGLYKHLSHEDISNIVDGKDVSANCQNLIDLTLERGAKDNVTAIVIQATGECR